MGTLVIGILVVAVCLSGVYSAGGARGGAKKQQQNVRGSQRDDIDAQAAEAVTASEVEYVDGPLAPLYDFLIESKLQQFCKLMRDSDIEEIIIAIEGPWTLFAPTDNSFVFLPGGTLEQLKQDPAFLREFLLRHFVVGDVTSDKMPQDLVVESLQSSPLRFNVYGRTNPNEEIHTVSGSQILEADLVVDAGRVHVVDQPLYPPPQDILIYLQNNHNQMYNLVRATGLAEYISSGTFTFLAPDDQAFDYLSRELKDALEANVTLAERILMNHLLPGTVYLAGITDGMQWETLGGAIITFTTRRGFIFANDIPIVQPEVSTNNGVIQTLNRVLLPEGVEIDCQCKPSVDDLQDPPSPTPESFTTTRQTRTPVTNRPVGQPPSRQGVTQRPSRPSTRPFNPQRTGQQPSRLGQPQSRPQVTPSRGTTPVPFDQPEDDSNILGVQPEGGPFSGQKRPDVQRVTQVPRPTRRGATVRPVTQRVGAQPFGGQSNPRVPAPFTRVSPTSSNEVVPDQFEGNEPGRYPDRDISDDVTPGITQWFNRQPTPATTRRAQTPFRPTQRTPTTRRQQPTIRQQLRTTPRFTQGTTYQPDLDGSSPDSTLSTESPQQPFQPQRPTQRPQSWNQRKQVTQRQPQRTTTTRPSRVPPPQRRPIQPPRTPVLPPTTNQPFESNRESPTCRPRGDRVIFSNRHLPVCPDSGEEPCQRFPYDSNDPRPFCPEDVPDMACRHPNEPFSGPSDLRPLCPVPPVPPQGCREPNERPYPGDRRPQCTTVIPGSCRHASEPQSPADRRPLCRPAPAVVEQDCRDPSEQWSPGDRRPLCRKPVLTGCRDVTQQQNPGDNRPPCPTCRQPGEPLDPSNPLPTCNGASPSFGCRRSGEPSYPQDTRPFCPEEENIPPQDCRPFLERPKPGDRRPLCKVNSQPPSSKPDTQKPKVPPVSTPQRGHTPSRGRTTRQPTFGGTTRRPIQPPTSSSWQPSAGPPQRQHTPSNIQPQQRPGKHPQSIDRAQPVEPYPETEEFTTEFGTRPTTPQFGSQPPRPQTGFQPTPRPHSGRQPIRPQPVLQQPRPQPAVQPRPQPGVQQPRPQPGVQQPRPQPGVQQPQRPQPGFQQPRPQPGVQQPQQPQPQPHPSTWSRPQPGFQTSTTPQQPQHQQQPQPPRTGFQQPNPQPGRPGFQQPGSQQPLRPGFQQHGHQPTRTGFQQPQRPGSQPTQPQTGSQPGDVCTRCPNVVRSQQGQRGSSDVPPPAGLSEQPIPGSVDPRRPVSPGSTGPRQPVSPSSTGPRQPVSPGSTGPRQPVSPQRRPQPTVPGRGPSTPRVPVSLTGTSTTPGEDTRRSLYEIVEDPALLIRGHPVRLTRIFDLFHKAGIEDVLTGAGPTTVFLPSDDAFAALPKGVIEQLEEYPDLLRQVLLYHVTTAEVLPGGAVESYTVPSLQGNQLVITMLNGGRLIFISGAKALAVTRANNGIFYVINQLLYPLPYTDIISAVRSRPDLSQLSFLLELSGLTQSLQGVKPYTLFAPTDDAFAQLSPVVLQELTQNTTALQELLLNHLTDGAHYGREFLAGGTFPSARGGKLKFQVVSYGYKVNDVNIKTPEIVTGTGVIHLVDEVLLDAADRRLLNSLENSATGESDVSSALGPSQALSEQPTDVAHLARAMGLNKFASWITNTGLLEKIHDGGVYTIFAPTDDAVNALPPNVADSIETNPEQVKPLLQYHIVPQRLNLNSVSNEETASTLLQGKNIRFNVYGSDKPDCKQLLTASGTPVGQALGTMGSVQVVPVNQVLYQPSGNLQNIVDASPILQNFSQGIKNSRLSWVLSGSGPVTIFAPSDAAFQSLTEEERKNLMENRQAFSDLLKRHMTRGSLFSSGVQSDVQKKSELGGPLNISLNEGVMTVNSIPVTYSDVTATNGVLHVIDQFL